MGRIPTTLDDFEEVEGRCKGNTTRQIDYAIQLLFEHGVVKILDHYDNGGHPASNDRLFDLVVKRLRNEHRSKYIADNQYLIISLQNE